MKARFLNPQSILTAILFLLLPAMLHAQATQGTILGTVHDSAGAVIPGATVTLTSLDEGTVRTTQTNATGDYKFVDVREGHYTVTMQAQGFEKWAVDDVSLAVRQELRVDGALAVGAVKQEVVVNGDQASAIDTQSPTISDSISADEARDLPVNTRASFGGTSAYNVLGTLPGMQGDAGTGGFSLQGALPYQLEVTVDGVTVKNPSGDSVIGDAFPSSESISEIRADGALANAEYGDPGQVVITTRGGTNDLHGTAYLYYQSSAFDAIPYTYPTTTTKPSLQGKTFGASLGGPVVLPHYNGHNKTFFYGAYEGWRHPAQVTIFEKVPSTLMKQGDFSKYNSTGFAGLRDPYTGQSWGTQVPGGAINAIAANTLKQFYPDPNIGDPSSYTDDNIANWQENVNASGSSNQFDVRGDQYFGSNQKFLLWGRFTWKNFPTNSPAQLSIPSVVNTSQSRVMRIDTNWSITPHVVNEGGFGFTRYTSGSNDSFNGLAWTQQQGFQGLQNLYFNGIPEMDFNHLQSLNIDRLSNLSKSYTYEYNDVLIWTKGAHTAKFGGDVQSLEAVTPLGFVGANNYGTYYFNEASGSSTGLFTGVDFGDFLLGIPNQSFYDVVRQDNDGVSWHYNFFAQDEWRANPRLTVTYGVRYELHPGYHDRYGDIGNFDPSFPLAGRVIYPQYAAGLLAQSFLASANACDADGVHNTNAAVVNGAPCMPVLGNDTAGYPSGLKKFPHLRFMPRLGFALRPTASDKWVVRGGFGMYDINMLGSSFYSLTGTIQAATEQYTNTYNSTTHAIGYQWPQIYSGSGNGGCSTCYGQDYFGTANSANWIDPYTLQWSMSVDHDLGSGYAARVSYIGSETHHLVWAPDENSLPFSTTTSAFNQPFSARLFPNWGRINDRDTSGNESYNSLQFEATHRMQHGLEYQSVFTWAKNLSDVQGPGGYPDNYGFAGEGGGSRATSILDRHADFGNVYGDRRLKWNTDLLYALPFGRGQRFGTGMSRAADMLAGGWTLSSIFTWQTGPFETPYFPSGQGDPSGTGSGLTSTAAGWDPSHRDQYADRVSGVSWTPHNRSRLNFLNASAFSCPGDPNWQPGYPCATGNAGASVTNPTTGATICSNCEQINGTLYSVPNPIGRFGNAQNGSVPGPGLISLSAGLSKSIAITESIRLRAEGTFTNVLNHTNLGDPIMDLSSPNFGQITSTVGDPSAIGASVGTDFGGARTGQIAVRLEF